jgi:hypothetical protein
MNGAGQLWISINAQSLSTQWCLYKIKAYDMGYIYMEEFCQMGYFNYLRPLYKLCLILQHHISVSPFGVDNSRRMGNDSWFHRCCGQNVEYDPHFFRHPYHWHIYIYLYIKPYRISCHPPINDQPINYQRDSICTIQEPISNHH